MSGYSKQNLLWQNPYFHLTYYGVLMENYCVAEVKFLVAFHYEAQGRGFKSCHEIAKA